MVTGSNKPGSPPCPKCKQPGDPVDPVSGLFLYDHQDLVLPDSSMPMILARTYRQGDSNSYSFGIGTESSFDLHLWSNENFKVAYLVLPDGGTVKLKRTSPGTGFKEAVYAAEEYPGIWQGAVMEWKGNPGWVLRRRDGMKFYFPEYAPLAAIEDRNGNRINFKREGGFAGPITQIVGPHGRSIDLVYDSFGRITMATDTGGQVVHYAYDAAGRLVAVTDALGNVTRYSYDAANDMTAVTDARGNVVIANTYDQHGRVQTQTLGGKGSYTFSQLPSCTGCEERQTGGTVVTDPDGNKSYIYYANGVVTAEVANPGPSEQWKTYTYDANRNPLRVASPAGTSPTPTTQ